MRYPTGHGRQTRSRIFAAAERAFRDRGFAGVGVDTVMQAADLTAGGFYRHFRSKNDLFVQVVRAGLARLDDGIAAFLAQGSGQTPAAPTSTTTGADLAGVRRLAAWYVAAEHVADRSGGCALPSLSLDVARADADTRRAYTEGLDEAVGRLARSLGSDPEARATALAVLSCLVGSVVLARAVDSPALAQEISAAAETAVERLCAPAAPSP